MQHRRTIVLLALTALSVFFVTRAVSQPQDVAPPGAGDPEQMQQEMMDTWMKFATPGEPHEKLMALAGEWRTTAKTWMAGPDGPLTESTGEVAARAALGGRWLMEKYDSEMLGMPFQGFGMYGYDNFKEAYVGMWVDNMSTTLFTAEGRANEAGDVITFEGLMDEPITGERDKPFKWIVRLIHSDKRIMEIHDPTLPEGGTLVMEVVYERTSGR